MTALVCTHSHACFSREAFITNVISLSRQVQRSRMYPKVYSGLGLGQHFQYQASCRQGEPGHFLKLHLSLLILYYFYNECLYFSGNAFSFRLVRPGTKWGNSSFVDATLATAASSLHPHQEVTWSRHDLGKQVRLWRHLDCWYLVRTLLEL